jgi:hypothetical protein
MDSVWNGLRHNVQRRGWDFHLTIPQLKRLSQLPCVYCGKGPSNVHRLGYVIGGKKVIAPEMAIQYSGIDRIDSTKGYIPGNVVPCCWVCNRMKGTLPVDEFFALLERIREHNPTIEGVHKLAASLFADS